MNFSSIYILSIRHILGYFLNNKIRIFSIRILPFFSSTYDICKMMANTRDEYCWEIQWQRIDYHILRKIDYDRLLKHVRCAIRSNKSCLWIKCKFNKLLWIRILENINISSSSTSIHTDNFIAICSVCSIEKNCEQIILNNAIGNQTS